MEKSNFEKKISTKLLVSSGKLEDDKLNDNDYDMSRFMMHDSIFYEYVFDHLSLNFSTVTIRGIYSNFENVFELVFLKVKNFSSKNFNILSTFDLSDFHLRSEAGEKSITLIGIFPGEEFSFKYDSCEYRKYMLQTPLSREDLGISFNDTIQDT
ncbi:MAG: hypothetical protein ACREPB_06400 [Arenimonas sp.]